MSHGTMSTTRETARSIWPSDMQTPAVNVGETERVVSVMGGGVLALLGLARGGLLGSAMALAGGALVYRGITGHCQAYSALGVDTAHCEHGTCPAS
jgi:uncharacterized membrane protein